LRARELVLRASKALRAGRYTLTRHWTTERTAHTSRQTIRLS
jgi:hypothetical protein